MPSSPDSSSDSSAGSPGNHCHNDYRDVPSSEMENCLPGVVSNYYLQGIPFSFIYKRRLCKMFLFLGLKLTYTE